MDCPICFEEITANNKMMLVCNHVFCSKCILLNLKTIRNCPLCRRPVNIYSHAKTAWNALSYIAYFIFIAMQFIAFLVGLSIVVAIVMVTPSSFNLHVIAAVILSEILINQA